MDSTNQQDQGQVPGVQVPTGGPAPAEPTVPTPPVSEPPMGIPTPPPAEPTPPAQTPQPTEPTGEGGATGGDTGPTSPPAATY